MTNPVCAAIYELNKNKKKKAASQPAREGQGSQGNQDSQGSIQGTSQPFFLGQGSQGNQGKTAIPSLENQKIT